MTATMDRCCDQMHEDGYCEAHNPLGGSYAVIRAELEANPTTYRPSRQRIQHEGFYGIRYRRARMNRRSRKG
jgi:hypothetical protein